MSTIPPTRAEATRSEGMLQHQLLDAQGVPILPGLTELAAHACRAPAAAILLADGSQDWLKARFGMPRSAVAVDGGLVAAMLDQAGPMVAEDTAADERLANHPWVGGAGFRFLAGVPLGTGGLGLPAVLCVLDREPRRLDPWELQSLEMVARQIGTAVETRRYALELERTALLNRQTIDNSADAIVTEDLEGNITTWNPAAARIFGYQESEICGRPTILLLPEELREDGCVLSEMILAGKPVEHFETPCVTRSGTPIVVAVTASPIKDDQGRITGISKLARDITARKKTESRFHRLVDSNVQGVIFWNVSGAILHANDRFLAMVGYTREDFDAGRVSWVQLTPPEFLDLDERALVQIASQGYCEPFEKEYIRKDGTRVPVLLGGTNFEDNPDEGVCFVLDLTERKKLEQQFLRAQRMESIGTLAGGVAHDLNNVLGPILMSIELLKLRIPDPDCQDILALIGDSARRGGEMVQQVLSFARGVDGQRMDVQVRHLIEDIEKIATDTFLKSIEIRTEVAPDLWIVAGDPTQLHQVLMNLCVNARDAMPHGGLLTISGSNVTLDSQYAALNPEAHPGPHVVIQVEDNGTGIPEPVMQQIFDPFFTTKPIGKGTGLGLSTSLAIVNSHGGFIQVYSETGRGTQFKIYLPAKADQTGDPIDKPAAPMPRGNGELVLVVDDEDSVRHVTGQTLDAFGYRVLLAADGAEAVAIYADRRDEIAVVLTDMMMPIMDGPSTIQVLRKINPEVRVIAASGLSANGHVATVTKLGVKHFLPKPYTAQTLLITLREILTGAI